MKKGLVAFGFLGIVAGANADEVTLKGTATGTFNNGSNTIGGLIYQGSSFDVTSSNGYYAIGGNLTNPNVNDLGSFTLSGLPSTYTGDTFTLDVTFNGPAGIQGGNTAVYSAQLIGNVQANDKGGVFIDFNTTPQNFSFSNSTQTGTFSLGVNTLSVSPGFSSPVTGAGFAHAQAVPEPISFLPLAAGFAGVAIRRKRRTATA